MSDAANYEVSQSVVTREIAGEVMLLDLDNGTYFGLDPVGAEIWRSLEAGDGIESIAERLESEFDVAPAQLRDDIDRLLAALLDHQLINASI